MLALHSRWVIWRRMQWLLVGVGLWIVPAYDYAGANRTYVLRADGPSRVTDQSGGAVAAAGGRLRTVADFRADLRVGFQPHLESRFPPAFSPTFPPAFGEDVLIERVSLRSKSVMPSMA